MSLIITLLTIFFVQGWLATDVAIEGAATTGSAVEAAKENKEKMGKSKKPEEDNGVQVGLFSL